MDSVDIHNVGESDAEIREIIGGEDIPGGKLRVTSQKTGHYHTIDEWLTPDFLPTLQIIQFVFGNVLLVELLNIFLKPLVGS